MELNLAPVTARNSLGKKRPAPRAESKVKGGWKKRRREQVKARDGAGGRAKQRRSHQKNALALGGDEFASGFEGEVAVKGVNAAKEGDEVNGTNELSKLPNVVVVGVKSKGDVAGSGARKVRFDTATKKGPAKKEKEVANVAPPVLESQGAIDATLAVFGKSQPGSRKVEKDDRVALGGGDANTESSKSLAVEGAPPKDAIGAVAEDVVPEGTFGASSFEGLGLYASVARHLTLRLGIERPTRIQQEVLKVMLAPRDRFATVDVLVRSATGSGKTLSYLLPMAHFLLNRPRRVSREDGAMAIIVVPTRELADQVEEVAEKVFRPWHWIVVGSVRGGESKKREKARLRKGINVLVATPGRLLDHIRNTACFQYKLCEFLVLDEADRLLDLGFEAEIKEMVQSLDNQAREARPDDATRRSNLLLSATLRNDVQKLAEFSLNSPVEISASESDIKGKSFAMPTQLRQHFCIVEQRHRLVTLAAFLRLRAMKDGPQEQRPDASSQPGESPMCKIIVFFSSCDSVDFHYDVFSSCKVPSELRSATGGSDEKLLPLELFHLHGGHAQKDRVSSLRAFRNARRGVLFCTDVAARGLDLKGVTFAVQYDPPTGGQGEELEYLHRAGRTARIGAQGDALLFLLPSEKAYKTKLEAAGVSIMEISGSTALAALSPRVNLSRPESVSYATRLVTSAMQTALEAVVAADEDLKQKAFAGFRAYCRAYATHARDVRHYFHVRNLHLGHVARAFVIVDKPAEFSAVLAEVNGAKGETGATDAVEEYDTAIVREARLKGEVARAIADGGVQPFNDQRTTLAKRRREGGRGAESYRELASEFGA